MALAKQLEHVIVVYAGRTITTDRPARSPRSINSRFADPIAASAAFLAIVDFDKNSGENSGENSSTAIRSWFSTTAFAHTRASCEFWRAAFFCSAARITRGAGVPGGLRTTLTAVTPRHLPHADHNASRNIAALGHEKYWAAQSTVPKAATALASS
ncbi:hypothetical protein [Rhodococcus sp. BH5]|uniref:hypothetical protein n=1 Tax=Rhodococcus sp. BH5 TaxID=2871702 RepID=UPI0022CD31D2|nr:hypothetical protein [Rhodococcus sp. BH5]MCZ9634916.1 hypothetical protein [Rhodococcus sp. BH5]